MRMRKMNREESEEKMIRETERMLTEGSGSEGKW